MGAQPVLAFGQHAAGAACRVADGDDLARLGQHLGIGFQQQVDHQANDLARGEVVTGRLVGRLIEAPDQVFEHQSHGDVINLAGVQVYFSELRNYLIEAVGFFKLFNLFFKLKAFENLADIIGKAIDVIHQMATDVVRVTLEFTEVELAVVVEAQRLAILIFRQFVQHPIHQLRIFILQGLVALEHRFLGGSQHRIETAQHGQG